MNTQFYDINQILKSQIQQSNISYFALALSCSRNQSPTLQTLHLLKIIYHNQGSKWIQVIRRLSQLNPLLVISQFKNCFELYRGFINVCFEKQILQGIQIIQNGISDIILKQQNTEQLLLRKQQIIVFYETLSLYLFCQNNQNEKNQIQKQKQKGHSKLSFFFQQTFINFLKKYLILDNNSFLQCILYLAKKYIQEQKYSNAFINQFYRQNSHIIEFIQYIFPFLLNLNINNLVIQILTQFSNSTRMYKIYFHNIDIIINHVCFFHIIKYNAGIKVHIDQNPEEIIQYQDDLMSKRLSETEIAYSIKLLLNLCDNVDGILTKIFTHVVYIIKNIFDNNIISIDGVLNTLNNVEKMQVCYFLLILLYKKLYEREDLIEELVEFFKSYSNQIFQMREGWIIGNFRIIRMIQLYMQVLSKKQFTDGIVFLFQNVKKYPEENLLSLQIYKTLRNILENQCLETKVEFSIYEISMYIDSLIQKSKSKQFFQVLEICIDKFPSFSEQYCVKIIKNLVERIHTQTKTLWNKKSIHSQLNVKCFDCLASILRKKHIVQDLYYNFENFLMQLAEYLKEPNKIAFQDKILLLASIVTQKTQYLTDFTTKCLSYLKGIYQKSGTLQDLFEIIYSCSTFIDKMILYQAPQLIILFTDIIYDFINNYDLNNLVIEQQQYGKACLLLQIVLQNFEPYFNQNMNLRKSIQNLVLDTAARILHLNLSIKQFDQIAITLYYQKPFMIPQINPKITKCTYANKMYIIYFATRLKLDYSLLLFKKSLQFIGSYFKLQIGKKKMIENYLKQIIQTLKLPMKQINEIVLFQTLLKQLNKNKLIDYLQLQQEEKKTLEEFKRLEVCGNSVRKIYKFIK